jgi:hypothetical protein
MTWCKFIGCKIEKTQTHHVTYVDPKSGLTPHTEELCEHHHDRITALNTYEAQLRGRPLTNAERETIFKKWLEGECLVMNFAEAIESGIEVDIDKAREYAFVITYKDSVKKAWNKQLGYAKGLADRK